MYIYKPNISIILVVNWLCHSSKLVEHFRIDHTYYFTWRKRSHKKSYTLVSNSLKNNQIEKLK